MKENNCYKLIQHFGGHDQWENVIAVSHDVAKLQKALKLVNNKGWRVLTDHQFEGAHQQEGNWFAIANVSYL